MNRKMALLVLVAGLAIAAAAGFWLSNIAEGWLAPDEAPVKVSGKPLVGGPFELVDETGEMVRDSDFRGRYMLVFFGFTFCPDVCPTELQVMSGALDLLGDRAGQVQPLFVTVDPERDRPAVMAEYVRNFHPSLKGLSGTQAQIDTITKAYRVYARKVEDTGAPEAYTMDHSAVVYFMGPDGSFLTHFSPGVSPEEMAKKISGYLDQ